MKQTVNLQDFRDAFYKMDRKEQFSYEGLGVLFNYIEEAEQSIGEEIELDFSDMTGGFVARIDGKTESGHTHNWKEISRVDATQDSAGEVEYFCKGCGSTSVKILPVMQPAAEENSSDAAIVLTVTGAHAYEMYLENARYIVTADSDTAILSGRLGNLADLKAQVVALDADAMARAAALSDLERENIRLQTELETKALIEKWRQATGN